MKRLAVLAVLLGVSSIAAVAQPQPSRQSETFRSETRVVLVDAVVTGKKGEYLRDLTAKDFRVWEDNREQVVKSFSEVSDSSAAEPRRLVLFFDSTGMSVTDQASVRQAVAGFIDANAASNRLIAVVAFDGGFHVAQGFTENPGRLKDAVRGLRLTASNSGQSRLSAATSDTAIARGMIQSLSDLARNLNAVPGRKMIVLLTGGASFAAVQPADVASLIDVTNRSNVAVYPVVPGTGAQNSLDPFAAEGGRGGGMGPLRGVSGPRGDDSVPLTIAGQTGGFVVSGFNDVLAELQRIGADQNHYYVLGYTPADSKEGTCHSLRVKVDRSGAAVRARSSYCAERPHDLLAESRVEQDLEKRAAAPQTGAAAAIQAPFFYISPNVARVHVAMSIPTDALKFENQKGRLHAEINVLGIASAADGTVAARFSDIVKRDFDHKPEMPISYEKQFKIVPGQYNLTVVFNSGGAGFGKAETPLTVDAYDRNRLALSAIALSREARPASELGLEASLTDEGTPLVAGGMQIIPAGSNAFTKSEQVFGYFEVYAPPATDPAIANVRILDAKTGEQKLDVGAMKLDPPAGPAGLKVPVDSLPSGSYRLEITIKTVQRTVDFEVR